MARTRSTITGGFTDVNRIYRQYGTNPPVLLTTSNSGKRSVKTIIDTETANFHALKKCGEFLPLNPVTIETATEERIPGQVVAFDPTGLDYQYTGSWWGLSQTGQPPLTRVLAFEPVPDAVRDAQVLNAASKAASGYWDALTTLAELRESLATMGNLALQFNAATYRAAKHAAEFRRNPWKKFRELWLGYRYGVRPILFDIEDTYKAIQKYHEELTYVLGRGFQTGDVKAEYDSGLLPNGPNNKYRITEKRSGTWTARGWAAHAVKTAFNRSFGTDPLVTLYEIMPYTFVLDRLINIGAYISTISPQLRGDYEGICGSSKLVQTIEREYSYFFTGPGFSGGYAATTKWSIEQYVRFPTGVPFPPINPRIDLAFAVDLAALFIKGRGRVERTLSTRR